LSKRASQPRISIASDEISRELVISHVQGGDRRVVRSKLLRLWRGDRTASDLRKFFVSFFQKKEGLACSDGVGVMGLRGHPSSVLNCG
jgi:hypothetical protein